MCPLLQRELWQMIFENEIMQDNHFRIGSGVTCAKPVKTARNRQ
jgi:hypothetical protein